MGDTPPSPRPGILLVSHLQDTTPIAINQTIPPINPIVGNFRIRQAVPPLTSGPRVNSLPGTSNLCQKRISCVSRTHMKIARSDSLQQTPEGTPKKDRVNDENHPGRDEPLADGMRAIDATGPARNHHPLRPRPPRIIIHHRHGDSRRFRPWHWLPTMDFFLAPENAFRQSSPHDQTPRGLGAPLQMRWNRGPGISPWRPSLLA